MNKRDLYLQSLAETTKVAMAFGCTNPWAHVALGIASTYISMGLDPDMVMRELSMCMGKLAEGAKASGLGNG